MTWGLVARIAGGGFGTVFLILSIIALQIFLTQLGVSKFEKRRSSSETKK